MNARRLVTALVIALVGSGLFTLWIGKQFGKNDKAAKKQQYVASTQNLETGEALQRPNLQLVDWLGSKPLEGGFGKPEDLVGRTVLYPLSAGQPIEERHLAPAGAGVGLSTRIPDGMRAISLKTDQVVGVAGFLIPGSHVDVLVTFRTPRSPDPVTATVLQDVQIIATGQKMQPDPEGKIAPTDVVTLLVDPQDAEKVVLASAQGSVHFVLRNGADHLRTNDPSAELWQLSGTAPEHSPAISTPSQKVKVPGAHATAPYVVVTTAGNKQTTESFQ